MKGPDPICPPGRMGSDPKDSRSKGSDPRTLGAHMGSDPRGYMLVFSMLHHGGMDNYTAIHSEFAMQKTVRANHVIKAKSSTIRTTLLVDNNEPRNIAK